MNEETKVKINTYIPYVIMIALIFGTGAAMHDMKYTIETQESLMENMTSNNMIYEQIFVNQQTGIITNNAKITQLENNTSVQVKFNIDVSAWADGIEQRLERIESQK